LTFREVDHDASHCEQADQENALAVSMTPAPQWIAAARTCRSSASGSFVPCLERLREARAGTLSEISRLGGALRIDEAPPLRRAG
jgi:hypothetical protein